MTTYIRTQSVPDMILQMTWQRVAMNTMALIILLITTITKKLSVCSTIRATKTLTNYNRNDSSQNRRREGKDAARVFSLNCWFTLSFPWTTTQCLLSTWIVATLFGSPPPVGKNVEPSPFSTVNSTTPLPVSLLIASCLN